MKQFLEMRQGDVGFVKGLVPSEAQRIATRPLALGEVTGHSHRAAVEDAVEMFEMEGDRGQRTYMRVTADSGVSIVHEEHGTVTLPKGWEGEIVIAREYDEEEDFRSVID